MPRRSVIVIGASIGGVSALCTLAAQLPAELPASVLVVLHVGANPSLLPELISRSGPLPCGHARDGEPLRPGRIYVAPPDHHMLVGADALHLSRGPKEHHTRPAIDPLFRSAALRHGSAVVGVVLTGLFEDGTAGLQAVKARGGVAVVQDPADAAEPGMPKSALRYVRVDHCLPLRDMGALLARLAHGEVPAAPPAPEPLVHEHALSLSQGDPMQHLTSIAQPSTFVCPDCQGALWEVTGSRPPRYRCHTGHAYTLRTLERAQADATDEALWSAIRALQEKHLLLARLADEQRREGNEAEGQRLAAEAAGTRRHAELLRDLVEGTPDSAGQVSARSG